VGACLALAAPAGVKAETLADAIELAYQSNPSLQSARAQLRSLDESYVQAHAPFRPTATVQIEPVYSEQQQQSFFGGRTTNFSNTGTASVTVSQPLYHGGAAAWGVEAASDDIRAGRESLRATEGQVLQQVVQAYVDVRRDQQVLAAYEAEVGILQSQLDDAVARKNAGEVTRTDVEQSQTQLDSARANLSLAQGQLQVSRAEYANVVGQNPGDLAPAPSLPGLPLSIDEAFDSAMADSPTLLQAEAAEHAASARISEARAAYSPNVQLQASFGYTGPLTPLRASTENRGLTVGAIVQIPLLTAGMSESNIRKAVEDDDNARIGIEGARRAVVQAVSNAWNTALASAASATSDEHAVASARQYFADTQEEYRVGQRSTLDVLIAEQTLRGAEVAAAQAEHDAYLAQAALLNAVGRLQAVNLVKDVPLYDPAAAFRRVRNKGATPWEEALEDLDELGAPPANRARPLSAPTLDPAPTLLPGAPLPSDALPATAIPTEPRPGTTSPATPPGLGADRGAPYTPPR
jgi:outer membrane protein